MREKAEVSGSEHTRTHVSACLPACLRSRQLRWLTSLAETRATSIRRSLFNILGRMHHRLPACMPAGLAIMHTGVMLLAYPLKLACNKLCSHPASPHASACKTHQNLLEQHLHQVQSKALNVSTTWHTIADTIAVRFRAATAAVSNVFVVQKPTWK